MNERPFEDVVYDLAQSEARRRIVGELRRRTEPPSFGELAEELASTDTRDGMEALERSAIALHHVHLPKLSNGGFVVWDVARDEIRPADRFDALADVVAVDDERAAAGVRAPADDD